MDKEMHIYMNDNYDESKILCSFETVFIAIDCNVQIIHTTNTYFCNADTLERGYKIFAHMLDGKVVEIKLGENTSTDRIIKSTHNLEKLLLANEFGYATNNK